MISRDSIKTHLFINMDTLNCADKEIPRSLLALRDFFILKGTGNKSLECKPAGNDASGGDSIYTLTENRPKEKGHPSLLVLVAELTEKRERIFEPGVERMHMAYLVLRCVLGREITYEVI